ncbi:MAG TPA: YcaO-like family protein [Kofleriaceae bacterium]|jgi:ribosomal protein S12 methylthiotransferase accessory factor
MQLASIQAALEAYAPRCGVTRIADVSRLDDLGIHVATATRIPRHRASISVASGRGASITEARCAAIAEAIERACAEPDGRVAVRNASAAELDGAVLRLSALGVTDGEARCTAWCRGEGLSSGEPVWIPAAAVLYPWPAADVAFRPATHGLAAGTSRDDAATRGLLECVERDAYAHAVARLSVGCRPEAPPIDVAGLAGPAARWLATIAGRGRVLVRQLPSDTGVAVALCTLEIAGALGEPWWHGGCAAAFELPEAVERAVGEALQSRLVDIQGAREDLSAERERAHDWFIDPGGERSISADLGARGPSSLAALTHAVVRLGLAEPALVDLSRDDAPLRVVRVVAPGLEVWAHDPTRIGERCRRWLAP